MNNLRHMNFTVVVRFIGFILFIFSQSFLYETSSAEDKKIQIIAGQSAVIKAESVAKVAIADPNIADIKVMPNGEILITAKAPGNTTLIIWDKDGNQDTTFITVLAISLEKPMIEVDVQVLEVRTNYTGEFGIKWKDTLSALSIGEKSIPDKLQVGTFERLQKIQTTLDLFVKEGHAKLLAKPRLLTMSGGSASFLSGGELPVVIQDQQRFKIEWKSYGVNLDIEPTADSIGNINITLKAEVSSIDYANAVTYGDSSIPALKTRWVKTSLYIKRGGTIVIAGLLQKEESKRTEGIPILSDIPLIGELFKHTSIENIDSELVIFVTPTIVGYD